MALTDVQMFHPVLADVSLESVDFISLADEYLLTEDGQVLLTEDGKQLIRAAN